MKEKVLIKNSFFDLLALFVSFILSFFRSILLFFTFKKDKNKPKENILFNVFDFIFRKWPKYFWKKPNSYKITRIFSDILNFIFNTKK